MFLVMLINGSNRCVDGSPWVDAFSLFYGCLAGW